MPLMAVHFSPVCWYLLALVVALRAVHLLPAICYQRWRSPPVVVGQGARAQVRRPELEILCFEPVDLPRRLGAVPIRAFNSYTAHHLRSDRQCWLEPCWSLVGASFNFQAGSAWPPFVV